MSAHRPAVAEERWITLSGRYPALRDAIASEGRAGDWKSARPLGRMGFFLLGLLIGQQAQGLIAVLFASITGDPMSVLHLGRYTGLLMMLIAEWLIRKRRLYRHGIEEGLLLAGLGTMLFDVLLPLVEHHVAMAVLIGAAATVGAGFRLLNARVAAIGVVLTSISVWQLAGGNRGLVVAALYCGAVGLLALWAGARNHARPMHDALCDELVILMPLAGFGWALAASPAPFRLSSFADPSVRALLPVLLPATCATACFVVGLWRRAHAPLVATLLCKLCLAFALREVTGLSLGGRLILWGGLALLAAFLVDRWLRTPRWGITTAKLESLADETLLPDFARVVPLAATSTATPPDSAYRGEGGGYGGGGASGRF